MEWLRAARQVRGELALHVTQRALNPVKDGELITFSVELRAGRIMGEDCQLMQLVFYLSACEETSKTFVQIHENLNQLQGKRL